jgi:hypothetical protein
LLYCSEKNKLFYEKLGFKLANDSCYEVWMIS